MSKFKVTWTFDKELEGILLDYIRKNIYSKYPKKSLKRSSLINDFKLERILDGTELTNSIGSLVYYYLDGQSKYNLYFRDEFITTLDHCPSMQMHLHY